MGDEEESDRPELPDPDTDFRDSPDEDEDASKNKARKTESADIPKPGYLERKRDSKAGHLRDGEQ